MPSHRPKQGEALQDQHRSHAEEEPVERRRMDSALTTVWSTSGEWRQRVGVNALHSAQFLYTARSVRLARLSALQVRPCDEYRNAPRMLDCANVSE